MISGKRMKSENDFEKLEDALRHAGRDISYPATPRLAARARAELEAAQSQPTRWRFGLWSGLAAAALALFVVLLAAYVFNTQQTAKPSALGTAYTANLLSGDLSVVNLNSITLTRSIAVGDSPWGIAIAPNGKRTYIAVTGGVAIVDTARGQRVDFVPLKSGYFRSKVAISADERILLVANPQGELTTIDMPTRGILNEFALNMIPYDIKLSPNGRYAYVLSEDDGAVAIVDVRVGQVTDRLTFSGAYRGYFMAQSPDGRLLYVPRLGKSEMWIVDTATNTTRGTLTEAKPYWKLDATHGTERGLAVSPDGARLYVATADEFNGGVSVLDTQAFKELARVNMGTGFFGAALSLDGTQLLLTSPDTSNVTVLDAATLKLITSIAIGSSPYRIVVGP